MAASVTPQLLANAGLRALTLVIAEPNRYAIKPKVDGVRGLVVYQPRRYLETCHRSGRRRDWLRRDGFEAGLRRLGGPTAAPLARTVLDGE